MPKKSAKKTVSVRKVSRPATKRPAAPVTHTATHRPGYRHSAVLSDMALMGLALFFALVGLLAVVVFRQQNEDFAAFEMQRQQQSMQQYAPMPRATQAPVMKKGK